ncbi:MAG: hypothetical protein LIP09_05350 [Bacteroidales bacterium]|nr:hypothetical protein [Bacteroidales bacterium]
MAKLETLLRKQRYIADSESFVYNQKHEREVAYGEGVEHATIKLLRNFKAMGFPTEAIAQASGLTAEEIEKL